LHLVFSWQAPHCSWALVSALRSRDRRSPIIGRSRVTPLQWLTTNMTNLLFLSLCSRFNDAHSSQCPLCWYLDPRRQFAVTRCATSDSANTLAASSTPFLRNLITLPTFTFYLVMAIIAVRSVVSSRKSHSHDDSFTFTYPLLSSRALLRCVYNHSQPQLHDFQFD